MVVMMVDLMVETMDTTRVVLMVLLKVVMMVDLMVDLMDSTKAVMMVD
jgi:hypothetical protein